MLPFSSVKKPSYDLALVKGLMRDGDWILTVSAMDAALALGFDEEDVFDCIVNHVEATHFYKTMVSEKRPGLMQDVYYVTYLKETLYVKLQVNVKQVVVSFKKKD
jgi:hypothetical protein